MRGELIVENTGDRPYRYETHGCGGTDGFYLQGERQGGNSQAPKDDGSGWSREYYCDRGDYTEELAPGEVRRVAIEVVASTDERASTACGGCLVSTQLPPGTYDVLASRLIDGYQSYAPPVVVTVTPARPGNR